MRARPMPPAKHICASRTAPIIPECMGGSKAHERGIVTGANLPVAQSLGRPGRTSGAAGFSGRFPGRFWACSVMREPCGPCCAGVCRCRAWRAYQARVELRRPCGHPSCGPCASGLPCACCAFVCRSSSLRGHRKDHAVLGLAAHHPLVSIAGAVQGKLFDHGPYAGEDGEIKRIFGIRGVPEGQP